MSQNNQAKSLTARALLSRKGFREQIAEVMPKHCDPDRMSRVAIAALTKTPQLAQCTPESIFRCMMDLSALGLEPDGRRAYLIPYGKECTLVIGYKGKVALLKRTGYIKGTPFADVVKDNDAFEYSMCKVKKHNIDLRNDRGHTYAAYCIIEMSDGSEHHTVMSREEIEKIRMKAPSKNSDAWRNHWDEMAKKTVFNRAAKWIPWERDGERTDDIDRFEKSLDIEDQEYLFDGNEIDVTPEKTESPQDELDALADSISSNM